MAFHDTEISMLTLKQLNLLMFLSILVLCAINIGLWQYENRSTHQYDPISQNTLKGEKSSSPPIRQKSVADSLLGIFFLLTTMVFGESTLLYIGYKTGSYFYYDQIEANSFCGRGNCQDLKKSWELDQNLLSAVFILYAFVILFELKKLMDEILDLLLIFFYFVWSKIKNYRGVKDKIDQSEKKIELSEEKPEVIVMDSIPIQQNT